MDILCVLCVCVCVCAFSKVGLMQMVIVKMWAWSNSCSPVGGRRFLYCSCNRGYNRWRTLGTMTKRRRRYYVHMIRYDETVHYMQKYVHVGKTSTLITHSPYTTHTLTHTHSPTYSHTHSPTYPHTHSPYTLTHSLTHSLTHTLTRPPTHTLTRCFHLFLQRVLLLDQIETLGREKEMLSHALTDRTAELELQASKTLVCAFPLVIYLSFTLRMYPFHRMIGVIRCICSVNL